jgi:hypothetical protein
MLPIEIDRIAIGKCAGHRADYSRLVGMGALLKFKRAGVGLAISEVMRVQPSHAILRHLLNPFGIEGAALPSYGTCEWAVSASLVKRQYRIQRLIGTGAQIQVTLGQAIDRNTIVESSSPFTSQWPTRRSHTLHQTFNSWVQRVIRAL